MAGRPPADRKRKFEFSSAQSLPSTSTGYRHLPRSCRKDHDRQQESEEEYSGDLPLHSRDYWTPKEAEPRPTEFQILQATGYQHWSLTIDPDEWGKFSWGMCGVDQLYVPLLLLPERYFRDVQDQEMVRLYSIKRKQTIYLLDEIKQFYQSSLTMPQTTKIWEQLAEGLHLSQTCTQTPGWKEDDLESEDAELRDIATDGLLTLFVFMSESDLNFCYQVCARAVKHLREKLVSYSQAQKRGAEEEDLFDRVTLLDYPTNISLWCNINAWYLKLGLTQWQPGPACPGNLRLMPTSHPLTFSRHRTRYFPRQKRFDHKASWGCGQVVFSMQGQKPSISLFENLSSGNRGNPEDEVTFNQARARIYSHAINSLLREHDWQFRQQAGRLSGFGGQRNLFWRHVSLLPTQAAQKMVRNFATERIGTHHSFAIPASQAPRSFPSLQLQIEFANFVKRCNSPKNRYILEEAGRKILDSCLQMNLPHRFFDLTGDVADFVCKDLKTVWTTKTVMPASTLESHSMVAGTSVGNSSINVVNKVRMDRDEDDLTPEYALLDYLDQCEEKRRQNSRYRIKTKDIKCGFSRTLIQIASTDRNVSLKRFLSPGPPGMIYTSAVPAQDFDLTEFLNNFDNLTPVLPPLPASSSQPTAAAGAASLQQTSTVEREHLGKKDNDKEREEEPSIISSKALLQLFIDKFLPGGKLSTDFLDGENNLHTAVVRYTRGPTCLTASFSSRNQRSNEENAVKKLHELLLQDYKHPPSPDRADPPAGERLPLVPLRRGSLPGPGVLLSPLPSVSSLLKSSPGNTETEQRSATPASSTFSFEIPRFDTTSESEGQSRASSPKSPYSQEMLETPRPVLSIQAPPASPEETAPSSLHFLQEIIAGIASRPPSPEGQAE